MKLPLLFAAALLITALAPAAATAATASASIVAVTAADDERCAATQAGDRAGLAASYSDDLHYAHSNGKIDTKASQIEGVINGPNIYEKFEYKDRTFVPAGPGVVLMKGRVLVHMKSKTTGQKLVNDLNYLAVWREENGKWRFLAWQSCRNVPPAPSTPK
jgi:ketosteroid isomerase-like protein